MKKEETVDYPIKSAWHAISRMYNQQAAEEGFTTAIGFVLININSKEELRPPKSRRSLVWRPVALPAC